MFLLKERAGQDSPVGIMSDFRPRGCLFETPSHPGSGVEQVNLSADR